MKKIKAMNVLKRLMLLILLGLSIVSCKNDDNPENSDPGIVDYHQTVPTQFITAGGTKFAYRVLGDKTGVPLVMISSLGSSMDDWDPAITNGLAQQYKVIIFDIQGVGLSEGITPDNISDMSKGVVKFINALGYTKVNLLGFSMGSFISQEIALTNPDIINKIILTGTGPKGAEGLLNLPNLLASTAGLSPEQFFLVSHFTPSVESQAAGKLSYARTQRRTENRDKPVSNASLTAELTAVLGWGQPYANAFTELKGITKPTFIAQGVADSLVPVINAIRMSHYIPGAQNIIYSDAGHGAFYQYHDEFVSSALAFLRK